MKLISLFCGAGGLDLGFEKNKFQNLLAIDFNKDALNTYKKNLKTNIVINNDIKKINFNHFPFRNIDVLIGGFPCQGFSISNNKRNIFDERNYLYKEMIKAISFYKPKIFIGENVKGILTLNNGFFIKKIKEELNKIGYSFNYEILNSSDFGVPQNRQRVIIYGFSNNKSIKIDFNKYKTKSLSSVKREIEFLSNIKEKNDLQIVNNRKIYNHVYYKNVNTKFLKRKFKVNQSEICDYLNYWRNIRKLTVKQIEDFFGYKHTVSHWLRKGISGSLPSKKDWIKLKELLNFDEKFDLIMTSFETKEIKFEQSLRITNWDTLSDTITASSPEIHVNKKRRLSVREVAILQTFPDDFIFTGSLSSMYSQIGNAVPPRLSYIISLSVKEILNEHKGEF